MFLSHKPLIRLTKPRQSKAEVLLVLGEHTRSQPSCNNFPSRAVLAPISTLPQVVTQARLSRLTLQRTSVHLCKPLNVKIFICRCTARSSHSYLCMPPSRLVRQSIMELPLKRRPPQQVQLVGILSRPTLKTQESTNYQHRHLILVPLARLVIINLSHRRASGR